MPKRYEGGVDLLTDEEAERIYRVTDEFLLNRDWVVVPLECAPEGRVVPLPDGKLLIRAPGGPLFEEWLEWLRGELSEAPLKRVPRNSEDNPKRTLMSTYAPRLHGTRNYLDYDRNRIN